MISAFPTSGSRTSRWGPLAELRRADRCCSRVGSYRRYEFPASRLWPVVEPEQASTRLRPLWPVSARALAPMRVRSAMATTRLMRCAWEELPAARAWTPCALEQLALVLQRDHCCAPRPVPFAVAAKWAQLQISTHQIFHR